MSVIVPYSEKNLTIFHKICELDKEFTKATDVEQKEAIIEMANKLCEKLELVI